MALLLLSTSSSPIPHPRPCSSGTKFPPYPPPDRQPGGPVQPSASASQCPPPLYPHEPVRLVERDVSLDHLVLQSILAMGILMDTPSSLVTARSTITIPASRAQLLNQAFEGVGLIYLLLSLLSTPL